MRPFDPTEFPPAFDDCWFDRVAAAPGDVRCVTPTLTPQGPLYEARVRWLSGDGSRFLTPKELTAVRAIRAGLELDDPDGDDHESD